MLKVASSRRMFGLPAPLETIARGVALSVIALFWVVALVKLVGLRSFSKITAFDFVATIAMGSLLATAAGAASWSSFAQVIVAMAALLGAQFVLALLRRRNERFHDLMGNTPMLLMENGVISEEALRRSRVDREDIFAKIRAANAFRLNDVRAVVLETTGDISVLHGEGDLDEPILSGVRRVGTGDENTSTQLPRN